MSPVFSEVLSSNFHYLFYFRTQREKGEKNKEYIIYYIKLVKYVIVKSLKYDFHY